MTRARCHTCNTGVIQESCTPHVSLALCIWLFVMFTKTADLRIPRLVHLRVLRFSEDEHTAKWFSVIFTDLLHLISLVNSHEASLSLDVVFSISWWKFAPQGLHPAEDLYGHSSSHVCRELLQGLPAHGRFWVSWKQNKSHHTDQCHAVQTTL